MLMTLHDVKKGENPRSKVNAIHSVTYSDIAGSSPRASHGGQRLRVTLARAEGLGTRLFKNVRSQC